MNDLERRLQRALDDAADDMPVSVDPWPQQQLLIRGQATRPRCNRTWLWVGLTAAATCLLLLLVLLIVPALSNNDGAPPATTPPTHKPDATQVFTERYFQRCLDSARSMPPLVSMRGARVRLVASDQFGQVGVITAPAGMDVCQVDTKGRLIAGQFGPWNLKGTAREIKAELVDEWGYHWHPEERPLVEWDTYNVDAGRVASNVARVEYFAPGHAPIEATVGGGVFVLRYKPLPGLSGFRAYDSGGRVVYNDSQTVRPARIPWP